MRNILLLLLVALAGLNANAQKYGNEWIDYSAKHYKFKLVTEGLHRISQSTLVNNGIPAETLIGSQFRLFRNGVEVPIYVSTNDLFGFADFIEFYGRPNDGLLETELYLTPFFQPNDNASNFTDSSTYFLAITNNSLGKKMEPKSFTLENLPAKEVFYWHESRIQNVRSFYAGENPNQPLDYVFDSNFDVGEGFGSIPFVPTSGTVSYNLPTSNAYRTGPQEAKLTGSMGYINNSTKHDVTLTVRNSIFKLTSNRANLEKFNYNIPLSDISNPNTAVRFLASVPNERNTVFFVQISYPRTFAFDNLSKFHFGVEAPNRSYVEITNFNTKSTQPIIYDFKNNKRYLGVVENNIVKCVFEDESNPKDSLYISAQTEAEIVSVTQMTPVVFDDLTNVNRQGNYLIISHKSLLDDGQGQNYVEQYRSYRESVAGGENVAKVYYIDDIENQFGYGISLFSPAIRNFINYAVDKFQPKAEQVFLIGKGFAYNTLRFDTTLQKRCLIPTYGNPASDILLSTRSVNNTTPQVGIGRLSVTVPSQIKAYLDKVVEYEALQKSDDPAGQTIENKEWVKNILHLGGGNFLDEQVAFARYLSNYQRIIEGPSFGGKVSSIFKNITDPVQVAQSLFLDSLISNGLSLITFFGHSSTSTVDFNLEPESFKNPGKYPMMLTNGCFVGNIFENYNSYSERFVLTPNKCAIGYIAPMTFAAAFALNTYGNNFYNRMGVTHYNQPIGNILKTTAADVFTSSLLVDRVLGQQMIYHGDPAVKVNSYTKPDYIITEKSIVFNPEQINASVDSFQLKVIVKNIGKAINTNYEVTVERLLPTGELETYSQVVPAAFYVDTVIFNIKTDNLSGLGQNSFKIKVDAADEIEEYSELNNEVNINKFFITDDVLPILPPEFGIVNTAPLDLYLSTANPLKESRRYVIQIDTTEFFNSQLLVTERKTQAGGVLNVKPSINLIPGKVYYWRGSLDSLYGNPLSWNTSSFLYDPTLSEGWNQSHYFQYLDNKFNTMSLPENRVFKFSDNIRTVKVINGTNAVGVNSRVLFLDNTLIARNAFDRKGFLFFVYDINTGKNLTTYQIGESGYGEYGNTIRTRLTEVKIIEFNTTNQRDRYSCYFFLKNTVPKDAIVCGYSFGNPEYTKWANDDSTVYGGETLFDAFEDLGVTNIRQLTEGKPFVFYLQNENLNFPVAQIEKEANEIIDTTFIFSGNWNKGSMTSPIIGPSTGWNIAAHLFNSLEQPKDQVDYDLYGLSKDGQRTLLFPDFQSGADISSIDDKVYPYIQLEMNARDDSNSTAPQLQYWRVIYQQAPEAAINPQLYFAKGADTLERGQTYKLGVAFQNITSKDMDSVLVKFTVKDATNKTEVYYKRFPVLPGNQFIKIDFEYTFNNEGNYGMNTIIVEANPDEDQPELKHFNNFAFYNVFVRKDIYNPLLDVTFDGRHITDGEIISPQPEILIRLKDENKFLALTDTSAFNIFLTKPNSTTAELLDPRGSEFSFVPADPDKVAEINEAKLYYRPQLPEDGIYELRVQGADRSKNDAGKYDYRIKFEINRKPAISNVLNYPNPFSTATQFVFTLTGTEIPEDIKIQIMTVSGKVVKEITRAELGNLNIGTNITSYKWDGTDTYGDRLANGLYLYRVVAKLNGKSLDMLEGSADKYFKKGFGKMYLVR